MQFKKFSLQIVIGLLLTACQPGSPITGTPTSMSTLVLTMTPSPASTATETPSPDSGPTAEGIFTFTPTAAVPSRPDEAILIQEPVSGSRVTSPIRVAGIADPTFEQTLVVRILRDDGTELTQMPVMIQADIGQRGPFEVEIPVDLNEQGNIFIQAYAESARDGMVTHLSSTGVIFSPNGPEEILTRDPQLEQIAIFVPQVGETIGGGVAYAEVAYMVTEPGPGRVVVSDPSPAFGGDTHLDSVEITLEP